MKKELKERKHPLSNCFAVLASWSCMQLTVVVVTVTASIGVNITSPQCQCWPHRAHISYNNILPIIIKKLFCLKIWLLQLQSIWSKSTSRHNNWLQLTFAKAERETTNKQAIAKNRSFIVLRGLKNTVFLHSGFMMGTELWTKVKKCVRRRGKSYQSQYCTRGHEAQEGARSRHTKTHICPHTHMHTHTHTHTHTHMHARTHTHTHTHKLTLRHVNRALNCQIPIKANTLQSRKQTQ